MFSMEKATTRVKRSVAGTKRPGPRASDSRKAAAGSEIDERIIQLADWRGELLAKLRILIREVDPSIREDVKWRKPSNGMTGVPVWSLDGIVCTGETYRNFVKVTFPKGASIKDPAGLFNASTEGGTRRAIDLHEGDFINEAAFRDLIKAALTLNQRRSGGTRRGSRVKRAAAGRRRA
jgi:hypothetical protein